jgi:hypothetical protein
VFAPTSNVIRMHQDIYIMENMYGQQYITFVNSLNTIKTSVCGLLSGFPIGDDDVD